MKDFINSFLASLVLSACAPTYTAFIASEPIPISSSPLEERVPVQYKEGVQRVLDIRQFAIDSLGFHKNSKHYTGLPKSKIIDIRSLFYL